MTTFGAPMAELFNRSRLLVLDFAHISPHIPPEENIAAFFEKLQAMGQNPREPQHRQVFNEQMLERTGARYLVSQYSEDRSAMLAGSAIAREGRTYHLGIDIFARDQEAVFAPCDGQIVVSSFEPGAHTYGNYVILQPDDLALPFIFFGHLASEKHGLGHVTVGEQIGQLGNFEPMENGGWSRHLHLQLLTELPPTGEAPIGYSSLNDLPKNQQRFPDPMSLFPEWKIAR